MTPDIEHLLNADLYDFINRHLDDNIQSLSLSYHGKSLPFDLEFALIQISARKKCNSKLAHFISNPLFIFPTSVAAEQSSHEAVAAFHSCLIHKDDMVLDMTAGLGIDAMSMAKNCSHLIACELDPLKALILKHNSMIFDIDNLEIINTDSVEYIHDTHENFDVIFIDPARRDNNNSRVYNLHDCLPDVTKLQELLINKGQRVLIKASPLLDITQTLKDIHRATAVRAISVNGECKEVLIEIDKRNNGDCTLLCEAIDMKASGEITSRFSYICRNEENNAQAKNMSIPNKNNGIIAPVNEHGVIPTDNGKVSNESLPHHIPYFASCEDIREDMWLYEPNASVMKLAPWNEIYSRWPKIKKLDKSSHLFISERLIEDFPGRILKIETLIDKKKRRDLKGEKLNVVSRNYPASPEELRKELKLKEGKDRFLYATRISGRTILLLANRHRQ